MILKKIISGAQNGADLAGLVVAKQRGLETGGTMPAGWRTLDGPKPEYADQFGLKESPSSNYPPRTYQNVRESTGTIRFAHDFGSGGERCTQNAISKYRRPQFDVHVKDPKVFVINESIHPRAAAAWIVENNIEILNVAGNSEKTCPGIGVWVERYLIAMLDELQKSEELHCWKLQDDG